MHGLGMAGSQSGAVFDQVDSRPIGARGAKPRKWRSNLSILSLPAISIFDLLTICGMGGNGFGGDWDFRLGKRLG